MLRDPVVAGRFYPSNPGRLDREIRALIGENVPDTEAIGCVLPHAGYIYSGGTAAKVLSSIKKRSSYVILGPNHTGMGQPFGLDRERAWQTPLGKVEIDKALAAEILNKSSLVESDDLCHNFEHSIEVQLPFLQVLNTGFKIVPIVIGAGQIREYRQIGKDIAEAISSLGRDVLIISSSDMTHYESHKQAKIKDKFAIDKILNLDTDGLLDEVHEKDISMCGYAPTAVMLEACKRLGAKHARLVEYKTSGETSGDFSQVVGYAGIIVTK